MSILLQVTEVVISAVALFTLISIARMAGKALETSDKLSEAYLPKYRAIRTVKMTDYWGGIPPDCGATVWVFRKGNWDRSEESTCSEGYEHAPKPTHPGEFEGHTVRRRCRRIPKLPKPKA
jgi:hypothetical protein